MACKFNINVVSLRGVALNYETVPSDLSQRQSCRTNAIRSTRIRREQLQPNATEVDNSANPKMPNATRLN
jgi:hypothetical protein